MREVVITPAEAEVLDVLIQDGASNAEIGEVLGVKEDTIKTHVRHLLHKFGLHNRTELAVGVMRDRYQITIRKRQDGRPPRSRHGEAPLLPAQHEWPPGGNVRVPLDAVADA